MKIGDFPLVEVLVSTRNHLLGQIEAGAIRVVIDGRDQESGFVDAVGPAIRLELSRRVEDIDKQLRQYGVQLDY